MEMMEKLLFSLTAMFTGTGGETWSRGSPWETPLTTTSPFSCSVCLTRLTFTMCNLKFSCSTAV